MNDHLMAIIDFCDEMASRIRADWSDPREECRAIWDAHDIAHVLLGGDAQRRGWGHARAKCRYRHEHSTEAWPDIQLRMIAAMEAAAEKAFHTSPEPRSADLASETTVSTTEAAGGPQNGATR